MTDEPEIIARKTGQVGRITLNRPKALNALTHGMCLAMIEALEAWKDDDAVKAVVVDGAGEKGFCAGGDILQLHNSGKAGDDRAWLFWRDEYRLNTLIHHYPKPYVALIDGITMGGGVGVSVHGSHRVAGDRTVFAMPETGIGLFPDVGGGWFLPRLSGELGTWLALTGARLKGVDVAAARVATHYLPSELIPNLKKQVESADFSVGAAEMLNEILRGLTHAVPPGSFEAHREVIDACFARETAEEIVAALEASGDDWAVEQAATLRTKSPETVKVALRQVREGAKMETFEDNMRMEYRIGWRKVQSHDFLEGVRAVIIDKDNDPKWQPATLEGVSEADVAAYFEQLGADELTFGD